LLEEKIEKCEQLQNLHFQYLEQNRIIGMADFSNAEKLIKQIDELNNNIEVKENEYRIMKNSLEDYGESKLNIQEYTRIIGELEKELPDTCPVCGNKL